MKLTGRTAFVTGAARGIGRGCALQLAVEGADVIFNDLSSSSESESLLAEIRQLGRSAEFVAGDIFELDSCRDVVSRALEVGGRFDILVSNPAFSRRWEFLQLPPEVFQQVLQGTLTSGFYVAQLVAKHMVERGGRGKIVFISSVHARIPYIHSAAYNAAKAGLNHMAFTIAAELLPHRINVNVIEPGWIDTPGEQRTFGDEKIRAEGPRLPWGRIGQPSDIGKAAVFLASDDADYITGSTLVVDGGFTLRGAL